MSHPAPTKYSQTVGVATVMIAVAVVLFIASQVLQLQVSGNGWMVRWTIESPIPELMKAASVLNPGRAVIVRNDELDIFDALNNALLLFILGWGCLVVCACIVLVGAFMLIAALVTSDGNLFGGGLLTIVAGIFGVALVPLYLVIMVINLLFVPATPAYYLFWIILGPVSLIAGGGFLFFLLEGSESIGTVVISGVSRVIVYK